MNPAAHARTGLLVASALLALPGAARGETLEQFLGFSEDASVYAIYSTNSATTQDHTDICYADPAAPGSYWPEGMARPAPKTRCAVGTCNAKGFCKDADARRERMLAVLKKPEAREAGPGGEAVRIEESGGAWVVNTVAAGKAFEIARFVKGEEFTPEFVPLKLGRVFWSADGKTVAVELYGDGRRIVVARVGVAAQTAPVAAAPPVSAAARKLAVQTNDAGMKLYRAKDWKRAAALFKTAVATDPNYITARYNLACVSSLIADRAGAIEQLRWLVKSSDPQAKQKLQKAPTDSDLAWILRDAEARNLLAGAAAPSAPPTEQGAGDSGWARELPGFRPSASGETNDGARAALAALPGEHDTMCDPGDETQGRAFELKSAAGLVRASLRDGVALFDGAGKPVATAASLGCTVPGASQDELQRLAAGQVVADPDPEYVILYSNGGRASFVQTLAVYKQKGNRLVSVFAGNVLEVAGGKDKTGAVTLGADGTIQYKAPGKKVAVTLRFDATSFTYK